MTAKELHEQKILPLEVQLRKLKEQYKKLWFAEQAEKNGLDRCCCDNCVYSCVLDVGDYTDACIKDRCIGVNSRCYDWKPETEISKYLRDNYHCDLDTFVGLANLFGKDFVVEQDPQ